MSNRWIRSRGTGLIAVALALATVHCGQEGTERGAPDVSTVQSGLEDWIVTDPTDPFAGLGRGRDLITEELRDFCIGAEKQLDDNTKAYSHVYLTSAMSKEQVTTTFDYFAQAKAKFWKLDIENAEFKFVRNTEENAYAIVVVYGADYALGGRTMDPMTRRMLVDPATTPNWFARCGDHFLMQTDRGAQLFVAVRIEFDSVKTKDRVIAKLAGNFGWGSLKNELDSNVEAYRGKALVHVEAFQKGGNVAAIGHVLGASNAVECGVGEMAKCDSIVSTVLGYAGSADFITGLNERPSDTRYHWNSWRTVLSANLPPERAVPTEIVEPRGRVGQALVAQTKLWDRLRFVKAGVTSGRLATTNMFRAALPGLEATIARNLTLLREAAVKCYDDVDDPTNAAVLAACVQYADPAVLASKGYDPSIGMGHLEPDNGTVLGHVDGTFQTNGATYLYGWACAKGSAAPISVQLFTGTTLLGSVTANLASEPAVAQACNSTGVAYRFQAPLDGYINLYGGKAITVYGISSAGDPRVLLGGSGGYAVPTAASRQVNGMYAVVAEGGHWYAVGWACALTNPNPIPVQMAPGGYVITTVTADLPSDPTIVTGCTGTSHNFRIPLDPYVVSHGGQETWFAGVSPYGLGSRLILTANGRGLTSLPAILLPSAPSGCGTLTAGQGLTLGEQHASCDGRFYLTMQADGAIALFMRSATGQTRLWATGSGKGVMVKMQGDGNFVAYNWYAATWATNTYRYPGAVLTIRNDGNMVVQAPDGRVVWATNTGGR